MDTILTIKIFIKMKQFLFILTMSVGTVASAQSPFQPKKETTDALQKTTFLPTSFGPRNARIVNGTSLESGLVCLEVWKRPIS